MMREAVPVGRSWRQAMGDSLFHVVEGFAPCASVYGSPQEAAARDAAMPNEPSRVVSSDQRTR